MDSGLAQVISAALGSLIAALVTAAMTVMFSRRADKQAQVEPNGERKRLQDEVDWLRGQLDDQIDPGRQQ
jgi:hypothetical protein